MNNRGQVFLMAVIIIVGIMISLVKISNRSIVREEPEAFFDLADEIGFETKKVLDYGVINPPTSGTVGDLASELLQDYKEYLSNEDVAFIYGDSSGVSAYYYQPVNTLAVSVLNNMFVELTMINQNKIYANVVGSTATVSIRDNNYSFDLKPGQNFYFVLIKQEGDEQFVTVE